MFSNISFQISIGIAIITLTLWKIFQKKFEQKDIDAKDKKISKEENSSQPDNKKWKKVWIVCVIGTIVEIIISMFLYKFDFVKSLENKSGMNYLMSYTYSSIAIFNKEIKFENQICLATMISVFPVSLFISIFYIFKIENKHLDFLVPTTIVSIVELIILTIGKSINIMPNYILNIGFALLQIYTIVYILANIEEKLFSLKGAAYISILGIILFLLLPIPKKIFLKPAMDIAYVIFVTECFIILNYTDRRFWRLGSWIFTAIAMFESIGYLIVNFM